MGGRHVSFGTIYGGAYYGVPFTVEYAVSNVVFLLAFTKPIGEKLERINGNTGCFPRPGGNSPADVIRRRILFVDKTRPGE